jgi:GntR family transcriptional regulator
MLTPGPLYAQAEALLRARIADGTWLPGMALPAEPVLAAELGVSQGTLRRALAALERARLIEKLQGKGSVVATHTSERALFHFFRLRDAKGRAITPTSIVTRIMRDARSVRIARLRLLAGRAVIFERITLPAARFAGFSLPLRRELPDELYVHYQRHHGVTVARADESLSAIAADATAARALDVAPGAPLLRVDRIAFDAGGAAVERRVSLIDTRAHHYSINLD